MRAGRSRRSRSRARASLERGPRSSGGAERELAAARAALAATWGASEPRFERAVGDLAAVAPPPALDALLPLRGRDPDLARWDDRARGAQGGGRARGGAPHARRHRRRRRPALQRQRRQRARLRAERAAARSSTATRAPSPRPLPPAPRRAERGAADVRLRTALRSAHAAPRARARGGDARSATACCPRRSAPSTGARTA